MKLTNNGHVGLEIEMLLLFSQLASGTKFMSKLCFDDTEWEYELLLLSTVTSAIHSALGALIVIAQALYFQKKIEYVLALGVLRLLFLIWCTFYNCSTLYGYIK